ncbi:MAG TPA: FAD-binding oxidoreductase, partial [Actinomycetota bacterium]|nr:FAD-binding oxidoreductase [Actinomycetota bacterium]
NEQVWLGGNEEQAGFDENITDGARDLILERMERVIPELGRGRVVRQYCGLRPVTPDRLPIVGLAPGWSNAAVALAGGRKGMLFGSAMGAAAIALVTGRENRFDTEPCSPDRFTTR